MPQRRNLISGQREGSGRIDLERILSGALNGENSPAPAGRRPGLRSGSGGPQPGLSTDRPPITRRSAVTNGSRPFVEGGDGNSPWLRRLRDVIWLHLSDLGGEANASEAEKSIIKRAAAITIELERLEAKFSTLPAGPSDRDLDMYQRCSNSLRRLLETVGIRRRPRDVTPTLDETALLSSRFCRKHPSQLIFG